MTAERMWQEFTAARGPAEADYEAWAFGGEPDKLAGLVLAGIKTATASAYPLRSEEHTSELQSHLT